MSPGELAKLIRMANQIAVAFESQGGDAADDTAAHLKAFWPWPMREAIMRHLAGGGANLSRAARKAIAALAASDPPGSRT